LEVCRKLRETYAPNQLPVVLLTARNQVSDLVAGFSSGANDYVTKPFSREELVSRVETHLKLHRVNSAMWRFVPHAFLQTLGRESVLDVSLGDQREAEMTVLFADIRSYTTLAESMTPRDNFAFINAYLRRIGPVIEESHGLGDQYYGDGIMALFGRQAEDAVTSAVRMQQAVVAYNRDREREGRSPIRIGIGIHTGRVILGIIGDRHRTDTGVISDTVNTSARMEGLTKHFGASVIMSGETRARLPEPDRFPHRYLGKVRVKGRAQDIDVYDVFADASEESIEAKVRTGPEFASALSHYLAGEMKPARDGFERVLARDRQDRVAWLFLEKARRYESEGLPGNWTGIDTMDTK
ncbi:adenylate/guanylate cyclase domain-containing response regulator, partial [bacterium]|nr:adenylate/guanylate cyclase domain-containing response regulator [bacterium]